MNTLDAIDPTKPIVFTGCRMSISDDPALVKLAHESGIPQLCQVSKTISQDVALSAKETQRFLDFLKASPWRRAFDQNLQELFQAEHGEPLLTGWLPAEQFAEFLSNAGQDVTVRPVIDRLQAEMAGWAALGVEDVYFDGYRL